MQTTGLLLTTMFSFEAVVPGFRERVRDSFQRQHLMATLGAVLIRVDPGVVEIELRNRQEIQQHGFIHAGAVASALDSACGYAAYNLMPADAAVLSVEFKVNLLAPSKGRALGGPAGSQTRSS